MHCYANRWHLIDFPHEVAHTPRKFFDIATEKQQKRRGSWNEIYPVVATLVDTLLNGIESAALIVLVGSREVGRGKQEIKEILGNGLWRNRLSLFLGRPPSRFRHFYSSINLFDREIRWRARWNLWTRMPGLFFSSQKGGERIRETLNSVTSGGREGGRDRERSQLLYPGMRRKSKICNGSSAVVRAKAILRWRIAASSFEMKYPVSVHSIFRRTYISTLSNDCVISLTLLRSYPAGVRGIRDQWNIKPFSVTSAAIIVSVRKN